jgi:Zn-dependent peptidase ImmA (M78 family)
MGIRGSRPNRSEYKEPDLLASVDDVIKMASKKGLFKDEKLDIKNLVSSDEQIDMVFEDLGSKSGSLKYDTKKQKWIISVNKNHHENRQRFTIAHEYGHYMLHREKNLNFEDTTFFRSAEMDSLEFAANQFAAKLLMPSEAVHRLIGEGIKNMGDLAKRFDVSSNAMQYRIVSLGYKIKDNG